MSDAAPSGMDVRLRAAIVTVASVGAAFTVFAAVGFSLRTAWSVGVGAVIATANLWILARVVAALLPADGDEPSADDPKPSAKGWALVAVLKMLGLFAGVWLLMSKHLVDPLPMLVGFGALPIGIAIGSIVSDRSAARKK